MSFLKIFNRHRHDYEVIKTATIDVHQSDDSDGSNIPIYTKYTVVQRCKTCGKVISRTVRL